MKVVGKEGNTTQEKRVSKYLGAEVLRRNPYVLSYVACLFAIKHKDRNDQFLGVICQAESCYSVLIRV